MKIRNRKMLFLHSHVMRGRYLRDDTPGGGGATPGGGDVSGAGAQGNSGDGGTGDSQQNNTGPGFDANAFWGGQGSGDPSSSNPGSVSDDGSGSDDQSGLRDSLEQRLNSLNFGEPVMTQEIFESAQQGDFSGFQNALNQFGAQAVKQALGLSVSVLKPFADQLMADVRAEIASTMGRRDDADQLVRDFPAAKDPKIRPVVDSLYNQALKNTKGDRTSAVAQVKEMMRLMSTHVADDLGLNVAPRSADDSGRPQNAAVNWLDELTAG